ncbi:MAG: peptidylprolyl isomerase [Candidatus Kapaibacterium sp.]
MENPVLLSVGGNEITHNEIVIQLKANGQYSAALQEMIKVRALENYAKENNIEVGDDELQQYVNQHRKDMKLFSQQDIQNYLGTLGISTDQWVDKLEFELLRDKIKEHVITDEKLEQYFAENQLQFTEVVLYKIYLKTKGAAEEVLMEARDDHENFSKLAMEYSAENATKAAGGYLGRATRGSLPHEVEAKVFTSPENEVLGPFAEGDYFTVYKVGDIVRAELDDARRKSLRDSLFNMWSAQFVQSQKIEMVGK